MEPLANMAEHLDELETLLTNQPQTHRLIHLLKEAHQSAVATIKEPFTITVEGGVVTEVVGSVQDYVVVDLD